MKKIWRKKQSDTIPRRRRQGEDSTTESRQTIERPGGTSFRRNRTLVGSLSPSVSSANELGGELRSPRAHVHHLSAHRRRLSTVFIVVLFGIVSMTWLLYDFTAMARISAHAGGAAVQEDRYKKIINDYFTARPGERLRVFLNGDELSAYMARVAPEVESVQVGSSAGIATTQFDIVFRKPIAGWLIGSTQYYVDKDGISFRVNYFDVPTVRIVDQSGVPETTGSAVASSSFLRFIGRTVDLARTGGMVIEQAIIPAGTTRQIEVRLAQHKYPVKLSLDRPVAEQVEDMRRAVAYFDKHKKSPAYIDVRVSGKAYYRY